MNYLKDDTIAALSTAAGKSAIAVIRLSGPDAEEIISKIFNSSSKTGKQLQHGYIFDAEKKVDEAVCAFFRAPHTYTGENLVEISVHGNPVIINETLNLLYKNGARPAEAGEFTYRAFLNGKMDLAEAEAVCALITSKTEIAARSALNNISGEFSARILGIKNSLTNLLAHLEASLDYPTDDIPFLEANQKFEMVANAVKDVQKLLDTYKISEVLQKGLKAAIIGKPNAGKSSLLNSILGKNRAIVTEIAGTTTDTIEEIIDCRGIPLTIIDTAGIRKHTENSIEVLGQQKTRETAGKADILIWVFDGNSKIDDNDREIAAYLSDLNFKGTVIGIINKSDLRVKIEDTDLRILTHLNKVIKVSSKSGKGIPELLDLIAEKAGISETQNDYLMVNSRHYTLLQNTQNALIMALEIIKMKNADELACFEIKSSLAHIDNILGINTPQDILDTIFGTFCIGK